MDSFKVFLARLKKYPRIVIQAHDFPDHDAVSSAYALSHLLNNLGYQTLMVYNGVIDRISLQNMIDYLNIPLNYWQETDLSEDDIIITVDGCIGEKNVTDLPGKEIAVIDHHQVIPPDDLWYVDVRPDYGATATIMYEYYQQFDMPMPEKVATALQVGLAIDTAYLTRGFIEADVTAFAYFHQHADHEMTGRITRNCIQQRELAYYQHLLDVVVIRDKVAFARLEDGCPKNMLGILGDFLLALDEVDVVVLAADAPQIIQLSLRSESPDVNVAELVRSVLQRYQIGFGGGHPHMAGGLAKRELMTGSCSEGDFLYSAFMDAISITKSSSRDRRN